MKLIIAEKASLGRSIQDALKLDGERFTSKGAYQESQNYYVVPLHGHIFELKSFEEYPENEGRDMWDISNLPFFPETYKYNLMDGLGPTYKAIKDLINGGSVDEILHCGDADREGQIIVDIILKTVKNKLPVTRPFIKATEPVSLLEAIHDRKPNSEYIGWHNEGLARQYIDFDFGINLSRYATKKSSAYPALNVGRVIGAIVTEIYNREKAIKEFVPEKYYKVESNVDGIKLTSKVTFKLEEKADAEEYAKALNSEVTTVNEVTQKRVAKKSPKLFSQTDLQGTMNKRFGLKPKETLSIAQELYEGKVLTYPRTSTNYIATGEKPFIEKIINALSDPGIVMKDSKDIFDDSKVEGHSAITPTPQIAKDLSGPKETVYTAVVNRFKAVFCKEPCLVDKTTAEISVGNLEDFKVSGETPIQPGWKVYEDVKEKDTTLPPLTKGQELNTDFQLVLTETTPPKHYTVDSLGKWMQNPFKKADSTTEEDYKNILSGLEIGTEATRADSIEKAITKGYISLSKDTYGILDRGVFLVETCKSLGIDMSKEKTAEMGRRTKSVYKGELSPQDALESARKEIMDIISSDLKCSSDKNAFGTEIGVCPICGEKVIRGKIGWGCSGWKEGCKFVIWENISGVKLTEDGAKMLLERGSIPPQKGFKKKAGGTFTAGLKFKPDFSGVEFDFSRVVFGHIITDEEMRKLDAGQAIGPFKTLKKKDGSKFTAKLKKNGDGSIGPIW